MYDWGNSNAVWGALLRDKGFEREIIPNKCPDCYTINDFCRDNDEVIEQLRALEMNTDDSKVKRMIREWMKQVED
jgi:hypothetical protein